MSFGGYYVVYCFVVVVLYMLALSFGPIVTVVYMYFLITVRDPRSLLSFVLPEVMKYEERLSLPTSIFD